MDVPRDIVYAEIYEILKNIDKKKVMKIPIDIINTIKEERNKNIEFNIDWSESKITNTDFSGDTINILGYFNYHYWTESNDEKKKLRKNYGIEELQLVDTKDEIKNNNVIESVVKDKTLEDVDSRHSDNSNSNANNSLKIINKKYGFLYRLRKFFGLEK